MSGSTVQIDAALKLHTGAAWEFNEQKEAKADEWTLRNHRPDRRDAEEFSI